MNRILLVEDNEMNRDMLTQRLERVGYEITIAVDGKEGVIKAKQDDPDLILMDMGLPKIDGWEATRRLKADDETSHIPIIALTGYGVGHDRKNALAAGCDDYSGKPVNFDHLQGMIEALL